ncbi:hypothetical protein [Arthrobacter sp. DR-2P]|nr:hypothetical protein [Arthrobacter sp. DR-2P]
MPGGGGQKRRGPDGGWASGIPIKRWTVGPSAVTVLPRTAPVRGLAFVMEHTL